MNPIRFIYNLIYGSRDAEILKLNAALDNCLNPPHTDYPHVIGIVTYAAVLEIFKQYGNDFEIILSDTQFSTCSVQDAKHFVIESNIQTQKYLSEGHDCDNFSYELQGYWSQGLYSFPFGIGLTRGLHAFNVFIDSDLKLYVVEPQTATFIPYTAEMHQDKNSIYKLDFILM